MAVGKCQPPFYGFADCRFIHPDIDGFHHLGVGGAVKSNKTLFLTEERVEAMKDCNNGEEP